MLFAMHSSNDTSEYHIDAGRQQRRSDQEQKRLNYVRTQLVVGSFFAVENSPNIPNCLAQAAEDERYHVPGTASNALIAMDDRRKTKDGQKDSGSGQRRRVVVEYEISG